MRDFVSGINAVLMSVDLPWAAFIFVSAAASVALWRNPGTPMRAFAHARRISPLQQQLSVRKDPRP
jgi:hypothetical protein